MGGLLGSEPPFFMQLGFTSNFTGIRDVGRTPQLRGLGKGLNKLFRSRIEN
jgi:hypothetical protein